MLVMFFKMEKHKDKGEMQNCLGIIMDLVDRSDEVVSFVACRRSCEVMPETRRTDFSRNS